MNVLFFADSGERAIVQAAQIGTVVVMIASTLLVIRFLDDPYRPGLGSLRPTAMQRTLDQERLIVGDSASFPCDESGRAAPAGVARSRGSAQPAHG